jgi:hypothetical protein
MFDFFYLLLFLSISVNILFLPVALAFMLQRALDNIAGAFTGGSRCKHVITYQGAIGVSDRTFDRFFSFCIRSISHD